MQEGKRARRKAPLIIGGSVIVLAVAALIFLPQILASQGAQSATSVIAYASATKGDVNTTITGSGTVQESTVNINVPVGIAITDVFVRSGDPVEVGDVLASVDTSTVAEVIELVNAEKTALTDAAAALGGSATIERINTAYDTVLASLNDLYSTGYIRASSAGVIGSLNVKKGDTVTSSTGATSDSSSGDTGDTGSGGSGASGASGTGGSSPSGYSLQKTAISRVFAQILAGDDQQYQIASLPYATTTASQVKAASVASAGISKEDAISAFLVKLCEARAWEATAADIPTSVLVEANDLKPEKGVYTITFRSKDDPAVATITYLIVENDVASGDTPPTNNGTDTDPGDGTGTGGTGTGSTGTGSTGSGSTDGTGTGTGGTGTGGTGTGSIPGDANLSGTGTTSGSGASTGTGSGASTGTGTGSGTSTGSGSEEAETVISSSMAAAFTILSSSQMQVQLQLDELDVAVTKSGQKATVELSALEDQEFEGAVSKITSSNGSYYAIITFERAEGMYSGFSATATIVKEEALDVLLVPLAAIQQSGSELFVYTSASEDGELGGVVTITTGLSDETKAEVLSGLTEGQTVYYQQVITNSSATGSGSGNMTGAVPSFNVDGGTVFTGPGGGGGPRSFSMGQ